MEKQVVDQKPPVVYRQLPVTDENAACPVCHRRLRPESAWHGVNYCRALYLFPWIKHHDGASAWELAAISGLGYAQASKALIKLRSVEAVQAVPEGRDLGGFRYRYYPLPDHDAQVERLDLLAHSSSQEG